MNEVLYFALLNQSIADLVFLNWFISSVSLRSVIISSNIILLILSNLLFMGFINLHEGLWADVLSVLWMRTFFLSGLLTLKLLVLSLLSLFRDPYSKVLLGIFPFSNSLCCYSFNSCMFLVLWVKIKELGEFFISFISSFSFYCDESCLLWISVFFYQVSKALPILITTFLF